MKLTFITAVCLSLLISLQSSAQTKKAVGLVSPAASIAAGQKIYLQFCLSCHMVDGAGIPSMNPPLSNTSYIKGDKTKLINTVLKGLPPNTNIDGQAYSNTMPAQTALTDQQVADVLTYVRNSFGNKYDAIKLTDVKSAKRSKKK